MAKIKYGQAIDLDDATPQEDKNKKLKFDKVSQKIRIGFPVLNPDTGKVIITPVAYFSRFDKEEGGIKKSFLVTGDEEFDAKVATVMGEPQVRYVIPVVVYNTDDKGVLQKPFGYTFKPYVFSDKVLTNLQSINAEFPISEHDVILTATSNEKNLKFFEHTLSPTKDAKWLNPKVKDEIVAGAEAFAKNVKKAVAMEATKEQISQWLGFKVEIPDNPADAEVDIDDEDDDLLAD